MMPLLPITRIARIADQPRGRLEVIYSVPHCTAFGTSFSMAETRPRPFEQLSAGAR
jgi:hypothetical protein